MPGAAGTPRVSVITPTYNRPDMLPHAYRTFCAQDVSGDIEWIVVDDSDAPSAFMQGLDDGRVTYRFLSERLTTGEKRNAAVDLARADIIVQFDDDDYYSPQYIRTMLDVMNRQAGDVVKLSSFFLYSQVYKMFGYWDLLNKSGAHFRWSSAAPPTLCTIEGQAAYDDVHIGYGFSYVFKRRVWEQGKFPPVVWQEDTPFIKAAAQNGFKIVLLCDNSGLCLHVLHQNNTSSCFPQHTIPGVLMHKFFPTLDAAYL